jgi:hypothetical protein
MKPIMRGQKSDVISPKDKAGAHPRDRAQAVRLNTFFENAMNSEPTAGMY